MDPLQGWQRSYVVKFTGQLLGAHTRAHCDKEVPDVGLDAELWRCRIETEETPEFPPSQARR